MSAGFPAAGANDTGAEVPLCADVADMAVLVLAEATRGTANNVERPPLSIFRRLGSGKFWLYECRAINFLVNYW